MIWRLLPFLLALAGCNFFGSSAPAPRFVVGPPYQADGVWRYPREDFSYTDTGLATVVEAKRGLTASGEAFDSGALAASHPTLQLPALARVTNLENGRQILVRINDRGPANAARLLGVSRRAAELLGAANAGAFRVRVEVQESESRRMASGLRQDAPVLVVAAAPARSVQAESLAPPAGATQSARVQSAAAALPLRASVAAVTEGSVPLKLPEQVWQTVARPGQLAVECGAFSRPEYANVLRERLAALGARVTTSYDAPRDRAYLVRIGPLANVPAAEAMLRRVLAANAPDSRIVVE